jgi:hypothetical protein
MLEDREVATQARSPAMLAETGITSRFAKVVRLVDWAVDWRTISRRGGIQKIAGSY